MTGEAKAFAPYRCVAAFADGSRLTFDGLTRDLARSAMESAMEQHGDFSWWDWVTDENYVDGQYHALIPPPPLYPFPIIDITGAEDPQKALQAPFDPDDVRYT
jgi:hypothetical protein